jgi:hypothetical protein
MYFIVRVSTSAVTKYLAGFKLRVQSFFLFFLKQYFDLRVRLTTIYLVEGSVDLYKI